MPRRPLLISAFLLLACPQGRPVLAQGTGADYARADRLAARYAGKVFRASVEPHWIGSQDSFWYRNNLPGGRREFVLVDARSGAREPAFDAAAAARGLSTLLHRSLAPDSLPADSIRFSPDGRIVYLQVGAATYRMDRSTGDVTPSSQLIGLLPPRPPGSLPATSRLSSDTVEVTFINRTARPVELIWIDPDGHERDYGVIPAGESRRQHTYVGHLWVVKAADGSPLAKFVAERSGSVAVIDGPVAAPPHRSHAPPGLSPDGKWRAYVQDHNVFVQNARTGEAVALSFGGSAGDSYEGPAIWSPDSRRLVVMKVVPAQRHTVTEVESSPPDQVQPKLHQFDYLKPGDRMARPRPRLFDVAARREIPVSSVLFSNPFEIRDLEWNPESTSFTFLYTQRGFQAARVISVDAATGVASALIDEKSPTFIDWSNKIFLDRLYRTHEAIWMSERDGWCHLYLYDTRAGRVKNQITRGQWAVRSVDRVDVERRRIWFWAGGIEPGQDPYYLHYCRVDFDGSGLVDLTPADGTHTVQQSPDGKYLIDTYSRVDLPPVSDLLDAGSGKLIAHLERADDSELLAAGWRPPEQFAAPGRDGKTPIYGLIYRPSKFDPHRKYPVVENIYAGPQGQAVPKTFSTLHGPETVAELGFIVVQIDGMGTNFRSRAFHDVCWHNLADAGFPDRIRWIRAAAEKYPYMDLSRVGIYGTSAGGQNALGALLLHGDFYKVGVADSGCHDNRMDKLWWNEQWMGWPVGPQYTACSNVTLAHRLTGKLLLMVGELDSNVDPSSTMQVVNALIKAGKDFDLLSMPGAGHGVAGTPYGQRKLEDFLVRNLLGVQPPDRNSNEEASHDRSS